MKRRPNFLCLFTCFAIALWVVSASGSSCRAQGPALEGGVDIPSHLLHEFENTDGEVIATGQFVALNGATLTIRLADKSMSELKMIDICERDRKWVKNQISLAIKMEKKAAAADKVFATLNALKPRTVISGCSKLRQYGRAASKHAKPIIGIMAKVDDDRAKLACVSLYPKICKQEWKSILQLTAIFNQDKYGVRDLVDAKPDEFLKAVATLDYIGLPFLQHVANRCTLETGPQWLETLADPIEIKFSGGSQSRLRESAINAIGEIKSEEAAFVLVDMASAVESDHQKKKSSHLKSLLRSLGRIGVEHDEVVELIESHSKEFPKVTEKALERIRSK